MSEISFIDLPLFFFSMVIPTIWASIVFNKVSNYWGRPIYQREILDRVIGYRIERFSLILFFRTLPYIFPFSEYIIGIYQLAGALILISRLLF